MGLHLIPFAWAFYERMFFWLGGLVCVLGAAGLLAGAKGLAHAAEAAAVVAGLVMLIVITVYARGRFAAPFQAIDDVTNGSHTQLMVSVSDDSFRSARSPRNR